MRVESELRAPAQAELVHFLCGRAGDDKGPKDGRSRLAGLEKRGLVGSFSPKRISEGRRYLKICTLSLGIRKWAPTLTRRIKVISRDLSDGGGRGGVVPGQSGGTCALVSPECQRGAFSLVTLEPGPPGVLGEGMKFGRLCGIPAYGGGEMGSVRDVGCISFSNRQEGMCGHQLRAGSKERNGAGKRTRRGRCPPDLRGCLRWPHSGRERAHGVCTHPHMYTVLQHLSLQRSLEEIILQHLFCRPVSVLSRVMCTGL